jgi:hypothetical protein
LSLEDIGLKLVAGSQQVQFGAAEVALDLRAHYRDRKIGNHPASCRCSFDEDGLLVPTEVIQPIWQVLYTLSSELYPMFPDESLSTALISCLRTRSVREDAGGKAVDKALFQGTGEVVEEDRTSAIVISRSESISSMIY